MALIGDDPSPSLLGNGPVPNSADKTDRSGKPPKNSLLSQAKANKGGGATAADTHNPGNKGKSQRSKPRTGQGGGKHNQSVKGRAKSNRRHGQNQQGEKASSSKRALAGTAVGALLFGAGGTVTGAAIVGGTTGVVALGSTVTGGLIGAAAGSAVPVVGTIVGAGVGLLVGALVGYLSGRASAGTANADYLNTDPENFDNKLQRSQKWAFARATMPENLGKRGLRPLKLKRRFFVTRIALNLKRLCVSISDDKKLLEWEARGRNALAEEARNDLRYAVAAEMSYTDQNIETDNQHFEETCSTAVYLAKARAVVDSYKGIGKNPHFISDEELENLFPIPDVNDPEYKVFQKYGDPILWRKRKYIYLYVERRKRLPRSMLRVNALSDERVKKWDFKMIAPGAQKHSVERAIYKALPSEVKDTLRRYSGLFRDFTTGTNARLLYDRVNNEVIISYNAGGGLDDFAAEQNGGAVGNYVGNEVQCIPQARVLGRAVRDAVDSVNAGRPENQRIKLVCTGHCRGGLLAAKDVQHNHGTAITFNPLPEGASTRDESGLLCNEVVSKDVNIMNYSVRNDPISGSGIASGSGNFMETFFNVGMPVIYGDRRILAQWPGTDKHRDPVMHMCHLIAGGTPPRKARFRSGSDVDHPYLYLPENHWKTYDPADRRPADFGPEDATS